MAGIYVDGSEVKEVWVDGVKCKEVWVDGVKVFPKKAEPRGIVQNTGSTLYIAFYNLNAYASYSLVDYTVGGVIDIYTDNNGSFVTDQMIGSYNGFDTGNSWSLVANYETEILSGIVG